MKAVFGLQNLDDSLSFVDAVKGSQCKVKVHYDRRIVDGCSLMGVLSLGFFENASLEVKGDSDDVALFMCAINHLIHEH